MSYFFEELASLGCSTEQASQALNSCAKALNQISFTETIQGLNEITTKIDNHQTNIYDLYDKVSTITDISVGTSNVSSIIDTVEYSVSSLEQKIERLTKQMDTLQIQMEEMGQYKELLSMLRPALAHSTENPKSKPDLEIFNQIIPTYEFIIMSQDNIFLN